MASLLGAEPDVPRDDLDRSRPKLYILDMFPYPSGAGLHVGHPEGYTATDILCRYKRMRGFNVLHPMGWDAFGLPAEQYAVQTNTHPRITTQTNIDTFRRQIKSLGFSYDWDREIDTTDPGYYKWTQWIFLKLHDTWYDPEFAWTDAQGKPRKGKGRPIAELPIPPGTADPAAYRDSKRLAYRALVPVNWCPALGTVLANEEVIDGKSERGGFPVVRMPLTQWMLRITAYAERLVDDLEGVDWPRPIKDMQRNWVGRSEGAEVDFPVLLDDDLASWEVRRQSEGFVETPSDDVIRIYTTRPDTLFGATYMVLAPEHPLVRQVTTPDHSEAVARYREQAARKSDLDRTDLAKAKTGVFTGGYAVNPVTDKPIPIWIADYVLMGYGTGAIMAVPGHDDRDFEFAKTFGLPIVAVVMPPDEWLKEHRATGPRSGTTRSVPSRLRRDNPGSFAEAYSDEGSRSSRRMRRSASTACRPPRPRRRSRTGWPSRAWAAAPSTTSSATGCSRGSGTGASRSRSSSTPTTRCQPVARLRAAGDLARARRLQADREARAAALEGEPSGFATRTATAARPTPCPSGPGLAGITCATSTRRTPNRPGIPRRRSTGCPSISTSAAPSTRSCTCSTAGSGTRCSSTAAWSARPSRSSGWSTRA